MAADTRPGQQTPGTSRIAWGIALPPEDVTERRHGKIVASGWAIWYLFGEDERGGYLDYYASHRMTDDRHVRVRADGLAESLPTIDTFHIASPDPEEDARLEAEYLEHNRQVGRLLEEKGQSNEDVQRSEGGQRRQLRRQAG